MIAQAENLCHDEPIQEVPLSEITLNRETRILDGVSEETILRYTALMEDTEGRDKFPPILLYRDEEGNLWLADGFHRTSAVLRRKFTSIRAIIRPGTKADAIWEAAKSNGRHGLPLGSQDYRRAVEIIVTAWPDRSNVMIADALGCDEKTVRKYRPRSGSDLSEPEKRTGKDGKTYPTRKTVSKKPATVNKKYGRPPMEENLTEPNPKPVATFEKVDTDPAPSCLNKDVKCFPRMTLNDIPQESPHGLLVDLFTNFRNGFVEEMVVMAMDMLAEKKGQNTVQEILGVFNERFGKEITESDIQLPETVEVFPKGDSKNKEKHSYEIHFEPDPDDDYFDWITDEEREELRQMQKANPGVRLVPPIRHFTIECIPEHDPTPLIDCLFTLFSPAYRQKFLSALLRRMFESEDDKENARIIVTTLLHEFQNQ